MPVVAYTRLRRIIRATALAIGLMTALAVPAGFGLSAYFDEVRHRQFQAGLAAERIAQYAYVQGRMWKFAENRLSEMIGFVVPPGDPARQSVSDAGGERIVVAGDEPRHPLLDTRSPIVVSGETVGYVTIETSLWPLIWQLALLALIGIALGLSVYFSVYLGPLRVLRRAIDSLVTTEGNFRAQIAETEAALEKAQHERQRAEAASETKSQFLANISHELRTPLNAIIGFSELMRDQVFGALSDRYRAYSVDIHVSGTHLLKLIDDVLNISKIETGRMAMSFSDVNIDDLLAECRNLAAEEAREGGVTLTLATDAAHPEIIVADRVKTKQIVLNLLSNAVKFTPVDGTVTLSIAGAEPGWVEITVSDTGIGMTRDGMERAVRPFQQVDSSSHSRKYQGAGLGLSIVMGLVRLHGGTFRLSSEPNRGTTAIIGLRVGEPSGKRADASWAVEDQSAAG